MEHHTFQSVFVFTLLAIGIVGMVMGDHITTLLMSNVSFGFGLSVEEQARVYEQTLAEMRSAVTLGSAASLCCAFLFYFVKFEGALTPRIVRYLSGQAGRDVSLSKDGAGIEYVNATGQATAYLQEVFSGFENFARMKGYSAHVATYPSDTDRLGLRFSITSREKLADRAKAQFDIEDYAKRLLEGEKFDDVPVVLTAKEHGELQKEIQRQQEKLNAKWRSKLDKKSEVAQEVYTALLSLRNGVSGAISPSPVLQRIEYHQHFGESNMKELNFQGASGVVVSENSEVTVGDITIGEVAKSEETVSDIGDLVEMVRKSGIEDAEKYAANLELLKEELEGEEDPAPSIVTKLLNKTRGLLGAVETGSEIFVKVTGLMAKFGL